MNNTKTKEKESYKSMVQSINLIEGLFKPSEASDILINMIDKKINFHKLKMIQIFEGNHNDPCEYDHGRIDELRAEKEKLQHIIRQARTSGKKLRIKSEIKIVEVN